MMDESGAALKRDWMDVALGVKIPLHGDLGVNPPPSGTGASGQAVTVTAANPSTPLAKAARDPRVWTQNRRVASRRSTSTSTRRALTSRGAASHPCKHSDRYARPIFDRMGCRA